MQDEGANITVNSVHPGLIMTNLMRHSAFLMSMCKLYFTGSYFEVVVVFLLLTDQIYFYLQGVCSFSPIFCGRTSLR